MASDDRPMLTPPPILDLLVIGGLTIDRFADGSLAPGGSVLHATRAAAGAGLRVGVVTIAGDEPEASVGLAELAALGRVAREHAPASIWFAHDESTGVRRLTLEEPGTALVPSGLPCFARAVLFAPVAGELGPGALALGSDASVRAAILQGWLRILAAGVVVEPLALKGLASDLTTALGTLDLLIASQEDLAATAVETTSQLAAVRAAVGSGPIIVVTEGPEGAWLDAPEIGRRHVSAPYRVEGVPMVGAGDAFAAVMSAELGDGHGPVDAAVRAARAAAELLAARRGR